MPSSSTSPAKLFVLLAACMLAFAASFASATQVKLAERKLNQVQWHTVATTSVAAGAQPSTKPVPQPAPKPAPQPTSDAITPKVQTFTSASTASCALTPAITLVVNDWRAQMLNLINQARKSNGVGPVCHNSRLNTASQAQSNTGVYGHTWNFVYATCYSWNMLGQNIAMGQTTVNQVFNDWYNEVPPNDGHRRNILNPGFNQVGNGWNLATRMWTQNFGHSSSEPCY